MSVSASSSVLTHVDNAIFSEDFLTSLITYVNRHTIYSNIQKWPGYPRLDLRACFSTQEADSD